MAAKTVCRSAQRPAAGATRWGAQRASLGACRRTLPAPPDRRRAGAAAKPKPKPPLRCNGYGLSTPLLLTDTTATQLKNQYPTLRAQISATIAQHPTGRRAMRAIALVLLSIAIMAFLLTDADAKRRSSAQGSQAAGASRSWKRLV